MESEELCNWLVDDALSDDIKSITKITVASEVDNITVSNTEENEVRKFDWKRLILGASILAKAASRKHQEAALRIATAAVSMPNEIEVRDAGAVLLEKLSNHRAATLAEKRQLVEADKNGRLGVSMRLEALRREMEDSVLLETNGSWLNVNDFQKKLWSSATTENTWISASAPTASGKTFLILQWLNDYIRTTESRVAVYLAPTRALVTEIEGELKELLRDTNNVSVHSIPLVEKYAEAHSQGKKAIFVFTQERLHLLINILKDNCLIDLLVVDEAHKIGDNQRGVILQDAVERISRINPSLKAVFVSPATQNPEELLTDTPDGIAQASVDSDTPTVLQNVILAEQVRGKPKKWALNLVQTDGELPLGILNLDNKAGTVRKRLAFIAAAAGERGGTLVYCNTAAEAEDVALLISQLLDEEEEKDQELLDLADLARKAVHRDYQLAPLVQRGVAFHYGNMPALIRMEIERLFKNGKIKFLACTSTLIEGVNLSCRTIIVRGPRKGKGNPMKPHDFWNLAGRAGRWGNEFQGNIICIEPSNTTAWPTGVPRRARYPIKRETDAVIRQDQNLASYLEARLSDEPSDLVNADEFEQVGAYLINTYLRLGSLSAAPLAKRHSEETISLLESKLKEIAGTIDLPIELAIRHPGVNIIGLQRLLAAFRSYKNDPANLLPVPSESIDAYDRFVTIMERVNTNVIPVFLPPGLIPLHSVIVVEWLKGYSLATMIRRRIDYHNRNGRTFKLPNLIRETLDIVEQTARFKAPKYLSSYVDILNHHLLEIERSDLIDEDFDIGVALEFGVSSKTLLSLMELGLSRMSAVELYEKIAQDDLDRAGCVAWVRRYAPEFAGMNIPNLITKEVLQKVPLKDEIRS